MSIAPETLLKMHPLDALRAQIGEKLKAPLKATHLKIEAPVSLGGVNTSVKVSIDKSKAPVSLWDRVGTFTFEYQRISLPAFLSGVNLSVAAEVPSTPKDLMGNLFWPYRIPISETDFVEDSYDQLGTVAVISSADSYRWVGEVDCVIARLGLEIAGRILVNTLTLSHTDAFISLNIKNQIATHLNLMNAASLAEPIQSNMFTISQVSENGPQDAGDNTALLLTFNGVPYIGALTVYYGRRSWPLTFRRPVKFGGPGYANMTQLAALLSAQMGCVIAATDIKPTAMPTIAVGAKASFPVTFANNSLAYCGAILVEYTRTS
jgi:hypothetical protein